MRIDWGSYIKDLKSAIKNERIWAMGSANRIESIIHENNARELELELGMLLHGRYAEVVAMRGESAFEQYMVEGEAVL